MDQSNLYISPLIICKTYIYAKHANNREVREHACPPENFEIRHPMILYNPLMFNKFNCIICLDTVDLESVGVKKTL